jgi:transcription elongation regulator 1
VSRPSSGQGEKKDPEKEYRELLRTEVKSTRTIWEDFRRSWKKDRRFWSYGKDDRAREKLFRVHLKELGESGSRLGEENVFESKLTAQ